MSKLTLSKPANFHGYVVVADGKYQYGTIEVYDDDWQFLPNSGGCSMSMDELIQVTELMNQVLSDIQNLKTYCESCKHNTDRNICNKNIGRWGFNGKVTLKFPCADRTESP